VGGSKVNGVSALHSQLLKQTLFFGLLRHGAQQVINQTNGVTPRRWMLKCNPPLSALITNRIGPGWRSISISSSGSCVRDRPEFRPNGAP